MTAKSAIFSFYRSKIILHKNENVSEKKTIEISSIFGVHLGRGVFKVELKTFCN
jgi:hypothetical protein